MDGKALLLTDRGKGQRGRHILVFGSGAGRGGARPGGVPSVPSGPVRWCEQSRESQSETSLLSVELRANSAATVHSENKDILGSSQRRIAMKLRSMRAGT